MDALRADGQVASTENGLDFLQQKMDFLEALVAQLIPNKNSVNKHELLQDVSRAMTDELSSAATSAILTNVGRDGAHRALVKFLTRVGESNGTVLNEVQNRGGNPFFGNPFFEEVVDLMQTVQHHSKGITITALTKFAPKHCRSVRLSYQMRNF